MSTGIDAVLEDKRAQEFWLRRLIGYIIDVVIIYVPIEIISAYAWSLNYYNQVPWLISGGLMVVYCALFEAELGYTIGKRIMNLEVVSVDARPYDMQRGLLRNITKIHWVFLVLDLLGGLFMENLANMRYLDSVVGCEVVDTQVAQWRRDQGLAPPPSSTRPAAPVTVSSEGAPGPTMPPEPSMPPEPMPPTPEAPPEDALVEVPPAPAEPVAGGPPGIPPPPVPPEAPPTEDALPGESEYEEVDVEDVAGGRSPEKKEQ